jgi:hypothetical protein
MDEKPNQAAPLSDPPLDPDAPPNLRLGLRDRPEVKALLAELSEGLKPGEDPLFYEMPDSPPDDPDACAPNEARVYVGPTTPPMAHHKTLELDRVKVAASVRAPKEGASPWSARGVRSSIDPEALPSAMRPEVPDAGREDAGREDAPPMSRPTVVSPRRGASGASGKRSAAIGAAVAAAVLAVLALVGLRGPRGVELAAPTESVTATVPSVTAPSVTAPSVIAPSVTAPSVTAPSASAAPSVTAVPSASTAPSATAVPSVTAPPGAATATTSHAKAAASPDDPYTDAAAQPSPVVTAQPSAVPNAQPSAAPSTSSGPPHVVLPGGDNLKL